MAYDPLPAGFDPQLYRQYDDLAEMSPEAGLTHYLLHGLQEGRRCSEIVTRADLLELVRARGTTLEIGPFDRPVIPPHTKPPGEIRYADWLGTADLRARAEAVPERDPAGVPHIDYTLSEMPLAAIPDRFDCICSSHCLEHQPDLIGHLLDVKSLLRPGGAFICLLPDKRYCFDAFIPVSLLPEIVTAHIERRTRPSLRSVIEHRVFTRIDFQQPGIPDPFASPQQYMREYIDGAAEEHRREAYVDVHCWYFTFESLRTVLGGLVALDYLPSTTRFEVYFLGGELGLAITF